MSKAVTAFDTERYAEAHDQAATIMNKSSGLQREEAAYLAGMSSYQTGNYSAAEQELGIAAVSSDRATAGGAKAMLGQVRLDQRQPREAATCFADASQLLDGEDARQAAWHAGLAYRQAGDQAQAKRWLDKASSAQFDDTSNGANTLVAMAGSTAVAPPAPTAKTSSARPSSVIGSAPSRSAGPPAAAQNGSVGFTLQVGAFNDRARAKRAAEEAQSLSLKESLGRVRVVPSHDPHGQPMYLVQVGWWVTRSEAAEARTRVGKLEYIVAPAAPLT
jgi:cell division septation protein DedD